MAKIRILPEQLANQIAAGEVVERPASVIKELIENSLDASAQRIEVEVEGGGTRLLRVIDNGVGMDEDDVLLSFERHGTSKITQEADLTAIESLGFRGEALPSIASVAKVTILSRTKKQELGTKAIFNYGKLIKIHETGCSQGTVIEVRNLFGNTPARRKFLRTHRTELGHIDEIVKNYALAYPDVTFILKINGKESLSFTSGDGPEQRLRSIAKYHGNLIPVDCAPSPNDRANNKRQLYGLLVAPEEAMTGSSRLRLFINGRAIRDKLMNHAAFEGLRGFMLKGSTVAGYLHLLLPASEIDVNVHPAKHEVRFGNSGDIHQYIKQQIAFAMQKHQQRTQTDVFKPNPTRHAVVEPDTPSETNQPALESAEITSAIRQPLQQPATADQSLLTQPHGRYKNNLSNLAKASPLLRTEEPTNHFTDNFEYDVDDGENSKSGHGMRVIGQYKNLYIFCQTGDNLLVVDQHAAHERLLYEKFRKQYVDGRIVSQTLMFPQTIELSPFQIQVLDYNHEEIKRLGFSIGEFGGNSYVLTAVPAIVSGNNSTDVFFEVLAGYGKESRKLSHDNRIDTILATMACKAAVKSGHELTQPEIDALLNNMTVADLFSHCPHGRPVFKIFTSDAVKKWFHRT